MNVMTLDLATELGFAMGHPPKRLEELNSGAISLRYPVKPLDDMIEDLAQLELNLEQFLKDVMTFEDAIPDLIVYEAPMDPQWSQQKSRENFGPDVRRSSKNLLLPSHLATTVVRMAHKYGVRCIKVYPITVRNTFIGKANAGQRDKTKNAVLERAKEYGYLPADCKNDNRADAVAIWHWAQIVHGKWRPPYEFIMGQKVKVHSDVPKHWEALL